MAVKVPPQRESAQGVLLLSPATLAAVLINTQGCTMHEDLKSEVAQRLLVGVRFNYAFELILHPPPSVFRRYSTTQENLFIFKALLATSDLASPRNLLLKTYGVHSAVPSLG